MKKTPRDSAIELTILLPRLKGRRSSVAHIMVERVQLFGLRFRTSAFTPTYGTIVACHALDSTPEKWLRWAEPGDPTCRRCLASLRFLTKETS
jgi:hypothetical protein